MTPDEPMMQPRRQTPERQTNHVLEPICERKQWRTQAANEQMLYLSNHIYTKSLKLQQQGHENTCTHKINSANKIVINFNRKKKGYVNISVAL